jgi:small conductance mechanosensitive channel
MEKELDTLQQAYDVMVKFIIEYSFQIVGAIIILVIGVWLAGKLARLTLKVCQDHKLDLTLSNFSANAVKILVMVFVLIIVIGKFGISIAPFIAALGALAFGSSFALQGPLSNYGAGITIIITRPFVVGDTISVKGFHGVVDEIHLAATYLTSEDKEKIIVPNKHVIGEIIRNSFTNQIVETKVGISYADDPDKAIGLVRRVLGEHPEVASEPPPQVGIEEFGDSSINLGLRYWIPTRKYFQLKHHINGAIFKAFGAENITIPFPQRDVRLSGRLEK